MTKLTFNQGRETITEANPDDQTVSFIAGGDFYGVEQTLDLILADKSADIISDIKPALDDSDFRLINFEAPMTEAESAILKCGPNLKMPHKCIDFLKAANIDIVTLANNHTGDFGPAPVTETTDLLDQHGIAHVGAGKNLEDAAKPLIVEHKGLKIAILDYAENEFGIAQVNRPGTSSLNPVVNISQIRQCAESADITLVFVHGGNEYNPVPSPRMVDTYRSFIEAGADAVIGNHTHCPQGIEIWQNKPIVYSTGNWLFKSQWADYDANCFWWHGYMVKLEFSRKKALQLEVVPYTFGPDGTKITRFKGKQKERFCNYLSEISDVIPDREQVTKFFNGWCMKQAAMISCWVNHSITPPFSDDEFKKMLITKNIFSCEAHHELAKTYLSLLEFGRDKEAAEIIPEIERLQNASFLFK